MMKATTTGSATARWMVLALLFSLGWGASRAAAQAEPPVEPSVPAATPIPESEPPAAAPVTSGEIQPSPSEPVAQTEPAIKPRLELYVPSVRTLVAEARRSRLGLFTGYLTQLLREMSSDSADAVQAEDVAVVVDMLKDWPDTSVEGVTFARDRDGRLRWALRLSVPASDLAAQVQALLATEAVEEIFAGLSVAARDAGGHVIALDGAPLAYILPRDGARAVVASHEDMEFPGSLAINEPGVNAEGPALLACRVNLSNSEKDSGATVFSSFAVVTAVDYVCRVDDAGDWVDHVRVHWPPVAGMAIKAMLGQVKSTFFVPAEAFGALVFDAMAVPTLLEQAAGLGAQAVADGSGPVIMVGGPQTGPIASHMDGALCLTMLPGTGFLPAPDVVVQCRAKRAESFASDVRAAIASINTLHRDREQPEPWHEETVRERTVFWCDSGAQAGGMMLPLVMRSVLFIHPETDAHGKSRDYLVIGWTSTAPDGFVRRWLDFPRAEERRDLPTVRKTNGQMWINWRQVYRWGHPYANLGIAFVSPDALLPTYADAESSLSDAWLTAKVQYEGLTASHRGPAPLGIVALPLMLELATADDLGGASDVARERLAHERLRVLYHHCKLFQKDIGRWPAEVAELDGYIDFAGNPHLLKLNLSPRKRWSEGFKDLFGGSTEKKSDDLDDLYGAIDDDLYEIDWGRESWRLGLAPGTLEHLQELYIDQDGVIHRVESAALPPVGGDVAAQPPAVESAAP